MYDNDIYSVVSTIDYNIAIYYDNLDSVLENIPNINIRIIKNNDYKNEVITQAFETKEPQIHNYNEIMEFANPILFKQLSGYAP